MEVDQIGLSQPVGCQRRFARLSRLYVEPVARQVRAQGADDARFIVRAQYPRAAAHLPSGGRRRLLLNGKPEHESRAALLPVLRPNPSAVRFYQPSCHCQPQPAAAGMPGPGWMLPASIRERSSRLPTSRFSRSASSTERASRRRDNRGQGLAQVVRDGV